MRHRVRITRAKNSAAVGGCCRARNCDDLCLPGTRVTENRVTKGRIATNRNLLDSLKHRSEVNERRKPFRTTNP